MNKPLIIILITVLLDIIGLGLVLPILPFIVESYGYSEFYVGLTFAIFSLGMFIGGLYFGKLSDKIGRNRALEITIVLNIIGYLLFAFSTNIYLFLLARFIGGLAASGFAVGQAYISDISDDTNRTKNMAMIGAMFGVGFMMGPVLGGFLSSLQENLNIIGGFSAFVIFINLLLVIFFLPKVEPHKVSILEEHKFKINNPVIILLLSISFIVALGFSAMQSTFPLIMKDRFGLDAAHIGYMFGFIGFIAIIYQAKLIGYVRKWLKEPDMIIFGLVFLTVGFLLFSVNNYYWLTFFIIFMFPVGYGTINPTIASMQSKIGSRHVGKLLGINASMISLGNVIGPFLAGSLYLIWSGLPYIMAVILFLISLGFVIIKLKKY